MKQKIRPVYMAASAILIWIALVIQFDISIVKYLSEGRTLGGAIVQLWSYFTIQNNFLIALAITLLWLAPTSQWGRFFSKPSVLGALSLYIIITFLVYQFVLRGQHVMLGWFKFCDEVFHTVAPVLFVVFWLVFTAKAMIPWSKAFNWLIYPMIYFIYIIVRGALTQLYPYSFLDHNKLTYGQIAVNFVFLLLAFLIVGFGVIGISRLRTKR
ncbi:Pr6Pr family membrane protein [Mucilaginibacter sp. dw_454]|uniref:Pr6Pr family membrane protein n=1 Tax=Mucilaginibacter sp. dw_454 TaxID=2720079 RepID=UPI001BD1EDE0|nr:Pr6Pr family membrane protein [Mucilaginibacter sp. dw_454]